MSTTPPPLQRGPSLKRAILIPQKQTLRLDLHASTPDLEALVNNAEFKPRFSNQRLLHRHNSLLKQESTSNLHNSHNNAGVVPGSTSNILTVDIAPLISNDLSQQQRPVMSLLHPDEQHVIDQFLDAAPTTLAREDSSITRNRVIEEMYRIQQRAHITPEERQRLFQLAVSMDAPKLARRLVVEARDSESEANGGSFLTGEVISVEDARDDGGQQHGGGNHRGEDDDEFCKAFDEVERIRKRILQRASLEATTANTVGALQLNLNKHNTNTNTTTTVHSTANNSARRLSRELKESPRLFISPRPASPKSTSSHNSNPTGNTTTVVVPSSSSSSSSSSATKWTKIHPEPVTPNKAEETGSLLSTTPRSPTHSRNEDVLDLLDSLIGPQSVHSGSKLTKKKSFRTTNNGPSGGSVSSNVSVSSAQSDENNLHNNNNKKLSSSQKSQNSHSGNSAHPPFLAAATSASSHNFSFHDPFSKPKEDQKRYSQVNAEQQHLLDTAQHNLSLIKRQFSRNNSMDDIGGHDDDADDNLQHLIASSIPPADYKIHPVDFSELKKDVVPVPSSSEPAAPAPAPVPVPVPVVVAAIPSKQAHMHLPPMAVKPTTSTSPIPNTARGTHKASNNNTVTVTGADGKTGTSPMRAQAPPPLQINPHKKTQLNNAKILLASPLSDWLHISKSFEPNNGNNAHNSVNIPPPLLSNGSSDANSVGSSSKTELGYSRDELDDHHHSHRKHVLQHHKHQPNTKPAASAANANSTHSDNTANTDASNGDRHRRFSFDTEDIQRLSSKYAHNQVAKAQQSLPTSTNPVILSSLELLVDKDNQHFQHNPQTNEALQHAKKSLDILQDHLAMFQQFSPTTRHVGSMPPLSTSSNTSKSALVTPSHIDFAFTPTAPYQADSTPRINSFIGHNNVGNDGEDDLVKKSLRSPNGPTHSNSVSSSSNTGGTLPLPLKKIPSFRNNTTGSINMLDLKEDHINSSNKRLISQSMMLDNSHNSEMDALHNNRPSTTTRDNAGYAPTSQPPYRPPLMVRQPSASSQSTNMGSNGGIGISPRPGSSSSSSGANTAAAAPPSSSTTTGTTLQRGNSAIRNAGGMLLHRESSSSSSANNSNFNSPSQLLTNSSKMLPNVSGANTPMNPHSRMYALAAALDAGDAVGKLMAEMVLSSKSKKT